MDCTFKQFDIDIKYRPGRENANAYALSRRSQYLTASTGLPNNLKPLHTSRVAIIRKPIDKQLPNIDVTCVERMAKMQSRDAVISRVRDIIEGNDLASNVKSELPEVRSYLRQWKMTRFIDNVLYIDVVKRDSRRFQLVASLELRKLVLEAVHDDLGHRCTDRSLNFVLDRVFWVGVWKDVQGY